MRRLELSTSDGNVGFQIAPMIDVVFVIMLFFMVMVPHQVLAQAMFMQHFSILFMPIMYICLGAVFDTLVFVALYSWVASNVPKNATV